MRETKDEKLGRSYHDDSINITGSFRGEGGREGSVGVDRGAETVVLLLAMASWVGDQPQFTSFIRHGAKAGRVVVFGRRDPSGPCRHQD